MINLIYMLNLFFNEINDEPYWLFILKQSGLVKVKNEAVHIHHIVPKYWFYEHPCYLSFMNSPQNLMKLSIKQHIIAHEILFELKNDLRDLGAIYLLRGQITLAQTNYKKLGAKAVHKKLKNKKGGFWNSEIQKKNASKSLAKKEALRIRSEGGKKGGYNRNINRLFNKNDRFCFSYMEKPFLCVFNCQTGGDIVTLLNQAKPSHLKRISALLTKKRKTA